MKNKTFIHPAIVFFLLTLLVVFLSWVGNVYAWENVQSLFGAEGLRWLFRNVKTNLLCAPILDDVLILLPAFGLFLHTGLGHIIKRRFVSKYNFSRKEKRACVAVAVAFSLYTITICLLAWGPVVRSVTGSLYHSPFSDGFSFIVSLGISLVAVVYGYANDVYRTIYDVITGMAYGFKYFSGYLVVLLFVVQFFNVLSYTGLASLWIKSADVFNALYVFCCLLPLFFRSTYCK